MSTPIGIWMLAIAWGLVLAAPFARRAGRASVSARAAPLAIAPSRRPRPVVLWVRLVDWRRAHRDGPVSRVLQSVLDHRRGRHAARAVANELPVAIDLLGVAVGAGCTPYLAVGVAAQWSPPPLGDTFRDVLRRCSLGLDFEAALDNAAQELPRVRPLTDALLASDRLGVPVGPVLARLADEDRTALRRAAEAHARRIPVRLLFPLVFLVLPAFVLLTVVPGLAAGLGRL
jgi:hypothetical protein